MKAESWYWLIRLALGLGVILLVGGALLSAGIVDTEQSETAEPNIGASIVAALLGGIVGSAWELFVGAGLSHFIVYGRYSVIPPMHEHPRPTFR